eukprot:299741-Chlamydomonas_euryale.AAC.1
MLTHHQGATQDCQSNVENAQRMRTRADGIAALPRQAVRQSCNPHPHARLRGAFLSPSYDRIPIPSYPVLSRPIQSYPILSYPVLSRHILSHPIPSYPILSYPILSYPI